MTKALKREATHHAAQIEGASATIETPDEVEAKINSLPRVAYAPGPETPTT